MSKEVEELLASVAGEIWPTDDGMWLVGEEILKKRLGPLLEAGQAKFAIHVEIEDCWYSCPKAENYCNSERSKTCTCGKDDWDKALAAGQNKGQR